MANEHGLDVDYFKKKICLIYRDAHLYSPDEMARELARLSVTADEKVINEKEFTNK